MTPEKDPISGRETTGHEWNGIKELNTPIPKAFRLWLWISIAVAALYWVFYPSFPYGADYLRGVLGYSSREAVQVAVAEGAATRAEAFDIFETKDVNELAEMPELQAQFEGEISVLYRDNCAACHGRDAKGQKGFPDLTDDHWLWSGSPDEIEYTLQVGINSEHEDTRTAEMPAIGRDEWLEQAEISDVIDYVLSLSGQAHDAEAVARGIDLFAENCASCHNGEGVGGFENGAPDLTDSAWLYGGTRADLQETLQHGRAGVMPAWSDRLTEAEIRKLSLYLLWQGQGDGNS
ncbi:cytochrome-c oxidase, cbb3-type subunit III [Tropicibacter sp. R15_0]|uniref:cytochrome-c oxidase, cbb3-type subunit III n=1 Tax=Tropicibacter sp. R15_0 TaxID=2821101 RepID=UPI001ADCE5A1|nr:cytochrome-c oxidase, cbb3-type subunit III [Tropicibacter sp. R15_0]MBO9466457.1 cytochrome-c oxidase, cbb3-type subunit III [Tropicibacter sp. R15_0]